MIWIKEFETPKGFIPFYSKFASLLFTYWRCAYSILYIFHEYFLRGVELSSKNAEMVSGECTKEGSNVMQPMMLNDN